MIADHIPYQIPEVWMLKEDILSLYRWVEGDYHLATESLYFPGWDLSTIVAQC